MLCSPLPFIFFLFFFLTLFPISTFLLLRKKLFFSTPYSIKHEKTKQPKRFCLRGEKKNPRDPICGREDTPTSHCRVCLCPASQIFTPVTCLPSLCRQTLTLRHKTYQGFVLDMQIQSPNQLFPRIQGKMPENFVKHCSQKLVFGAPGGSVG